MRSQPTSRLRRFSFGKPVGVTNDRGFVSRTAPNWLRFAAALQTTVASFRARLRIGFVSPRRYKLPWLRFAHGSELASFRRGVTNYRGFVSRTARNWLRLGAALQITVGSFRARLGIGFVSARRYRLPWVRFAHGSELASFRRGVTNYRGFVSRTTPNWLRFGAALQITVASFRRNRAVRTGCLGCERCASSYCQRPCRSRGADPQTILSRRDCPPNRPTAWRGAALALSSG